MPWLYTYPNAVATEADTNTVFDVKVGRGACSMDDVELTPQVSSKHKFDDVAMQRLRAEFWGIFQQNQRRVAMQHLIDSKFGGDTMQASIAIQRISKKSVAHRTIQAWLMDPGALSSRNCPEWAVIALKAFVDDPKNDEYLKSCERMAKSTASYMPHSTAVDVKYGVKYATSAIISDEKRLKAWCEASFVSLPQMISRFENTTERHLEHLDHHVHAMWRALREATDFEDYRKRVLDEVKDKETANMIIRNTRRAIEQGADEFPNY